MWCSQPAPPVSGFRCQAYEWVTPRGVLVMHQRKAARSHRPRRDCEVSARSSALPSHQPSEPSAPHEGHLTCHLDEERVPRAACSSRKLPSGDQSGEGRPNLFQRRATGRRASATVAAKLWRCQGRSDAENATCHCVCRCSYIKTRHPVTRQDTVQCDQSPNLEGRGIGPFCGPPQEGYNVDMGERSGRSRCTAAHSCVTHCLVILAHRKG